MTDNSQAAHEVAMAAALAELNASPKHGLHDFARTYIAHLRPTIEAASRVTSDRDGMAAALREAYVALAFAFNRLHGSSRSRDGELCSDIQKTRARIERAMKETGYVL